MLLFAIWLAHFALSPFGSPGYFGRQQQIARAGRLVPVCRHQVRSPNTLRSCGDGSSVVFGGDSDG